MAKPNAPKDMKPKDGEMDSASKGGSSKVLLINVITTGIICSMFIVANYFIQDFLFTKKMAHSATSTEEELAEEHSTDDERGLIIDLGDFTVNLSDPNSRRYLKTSVALEVSKLPSDNKPAEKSGGHGGHGGGAPAVSPIEAEMAQYKPAIRDAIISALSSKTSTELSTTAGKELTKDEIIDSVDSIFGGEREVIRVSFAKFIMQ